jgi:hypothetical protein
MKDHKFYKQTTLAPFTPVVHIPKPPTPDELTIAMAIFCVLTERELPAKLDAAVCKLEPDDFKEPIKHLLVMWGMKVPDLEILKVVFITELEFELKKSRQSNKDIKAPDNYDKAEI